MLIALVTTFWTNSCNSIGISKEKRDLSHEGDPSDYLEGLTYVWNGSGSVGEDSWYWSGRRNEG